MERKKNYFIPILFFTLMLFKVSSFHVYSHHDDASDVNENCEVCEVALENQDPDYIFYPSQLVVIADAYPIIIEQSSEYQIAAFSSIFYAAFYGRPPPSIG